ncbi:hypothetical protein YC2023_031677 [Brassica napus]
MTGSNAAVAVAGVCRCGWLRFLAVLRDLYDWFCEVRSSLKRFIAVCMIVSKRCQPLPTAKAAFAGGSGETNQAIRVGDLVVVCHT